VIVYSAITTGGLGTASTTATDTTFNVPDAPVLTVISGDNTATVSWTTPSANGGTLSPYTLTITDNTDVTSTSSNPLASENEKIVSLINGHSYTFVIFANSEVGRSVDSNIVPITPLGAPGQMAAPSATIGDGEVALTWIAPDLNGSGAITEYTITYDDVNDDEQTVTISAPTLTTTIDGLTNGHNYSFTITATNNNAITSAPSDPVTAIPLGAPGQMAAPSATIGDGEVALTWIAPGLDGSGAITEYTITYDDVNDEEQTVTITAPTLTTTIDGLTNGHSYSFTITATNSNSNTSTPSLPVTVTTLGAPGVVTFLSPVVGDRQVTLNWSEPADNNSGSIIKYTITYDDASNDEQTVTVLAPALTTTISSLTNGHTYSFTITATNSNDITSNPSDSLIITPVTKPAAPTITEANRGNGIVELKWTPSADDGGDLLDQFTVQWSSNNFVDTTTEIVTIDPPVTSPATIYTTTATSLINGDIYQFRVYSHNALGQSVASNILSATPATLPDAPTLLTADRGDTSVALTWSQGSTGGADIESFRIEVSTVQDFTTTVQDFTITDPLATGTSVSGLTNGDTYYFRVYSTNAVDESLSSNTLSQIPATVPGTPLNVLATPASNQVTVTWDAPSDDGGSAIDFYVVKYRTAESAWTEIQTADATVFSVVIDSLANGTPYFFEVYAENDVGAGDPSDQLTATPATVPTAPQNLDATPQTGQVLLEWGIPSSNGGAEITSYTVKWSEGDTFDSNDFASVEITGIDSNPPLTTTTVTTLTNGQPYTFVVTATNSAGESASSNDDTATPAAAPTAPTLLEGIPHSSRTCPV